MFDAWTMMWIHIGAGFTGALSLVLYARNLARSFGWVPDFKVYFSPKGGCQDAVVRELNNARREILVQAYSFTADPLTLALVEAKNRGVDVEILLDKSNETESYSDLHLFLEKGVHPLIDHDHAIAHNKVILIDGRVIVTGSFNFTNQAEHENAENLLILRNDIDLLAAYRENFMKHKAHCKPAVVKEAKTRDRHGHKAA